MFNLLKDKVSCLRNLKEKLPPRDKVKRFLLALIGLGDELPIKWAVLNHITQIFILSLPLVLMDIFIRILSSEVSYSRAVMVVPSILFSLGWITLIVSVSYCLKGIFSRIFYGINFGVFFSLFFTQIVYFSYTDFFFGFRLLQSADEGKAYIWDTLKNTNPIYFLICGTILAMGILILIKFPKRRRYHLKTMGVFIAAFVLVHLITPLLLGSANRALEWDTWRNPRNVYQSFSDSNKCMKICGIYEYTVRDLYTTFFKPKEKDDPEELAFLQEVYSENTPHSENGLTGMFEGKNIIFLQLEGIDSWLFNPSTMPNTYSLLENAINFNNHFSYYNGGGSTFNSELAVNTGFITPISYNRNAYTFNTNMFKYSLPNLLKKEGYSVNAFHMNTGEYYARELNYLNWGYDNYYSLMEEKSYTDVSYQLDTELILNESFYDKMFRQDGPFMNYVITYTPHTPFTLDSPMGKLLAKKLYEEGQEIPELTEEDVAKIFAAETDDMVGLMMQALKDNNLYENTVIVAFADHYLYTLNDKTILDQYKVTSNNIINHTPFFIWSHDMYDVDVSKVTSQLDILPTVLNLLGIEYTNEYYIGHDALAYDRRQGYVFFSDHSWYDGEVYVEYGEVTLGDKYDQEYVDKTNDEINRKIRQNDLTLKYDYFRRMEKKENKR